MLTRILQQDGHNNSEVTLIASFVFFGLLSGIILREIHKKTNIPYTPVLMILGLLVSLIGQKVNIIGETTSLITHMDPAGILLIFIPILIFESSFKADWHVFQRSFKQILLLAGPGLMISFSLVAIAMKVILRYDDNELSWSAALMLGAIVAATDPVAIVALLKNLGAPHYFSTIVEGESILNDGTGVVCFTIFANVASGKDIDVGTGISFFLFLCLGGVALGFIFSILTSSWLEKILNDSVLSISIIITASYLLFWVSETFRATFTSDVKGGVSGILALCTLGLFLSAYRKTKISSRIEHPLHTVIQWTQYVSETLIFLITGIIVGKFLFHPEKTIGASDWLRLFAYFILLNLIRAFLVTILSPLLNRWGYKMNFKELFILSYAGLRGALGLSLALSVHYDERSLPRRTRELVLFYVAGTAALTLLVNGMTTGLIVKKIKLIKEFPVKKKILKTFMDEIEQVACNTYEDLRLDNAAAICDWNSVKGILKINNNAEGIQIGIGSTQLEDNKLDDEEELQTEARYKLLHAFKELVWKRYENGEIEAYGANTLDKAVNVSLDDLQVRINIFDFLYMYFIDPSSLGFVAKCSKLPLIGKYFRNLIINQLVFIYDVTTSFVSLINDLKIAKDKLLMSEALDHEIFQEFERDQKSAISYLNKLQDQFLNIVTYITTKRYITRILMAQKRFINEKYDVCAIETKEYNKLSSLIDKKIRNLPKLLKVKWEPPTFSSLILSFPIFNILTEAQVKKILTNSQKVKFKSGEHLFKEGEPFDSIYLITKGEAKTSYQSYKSAHKGVGSLVSFFNLVMFDNISRVNCQALQRTEAQKINLKALREIMQENPEFEEKVYKGALWHLRFMKPKKAQELIKLNDNQLKTLSQSAEIVYFTKGESLKLPNGGFVLKGQLKRLEIVYNEYCMAPQHSKALTALTDGILMKFYGTARGSPRSPLSRAKMVSEINEDWEQELVSPNHAKNLEKIPLADPFKRKEKFALQRP